MLRGTRSGAAYWSRRARGQKTSWKSSSGKCSARSAISRSSLTQRVVVVIAVQHDGVGDRRGVRARPGSSPPPLPARGAHPSARSGPRPQPARRDHPAPLGSAHRSSSWVSRPSLGADLDDGLDPRRVEAGAPDLVEVPQGVPRLVRIRTVVIGGTFLAMASWAPVPASGEPTRLPTLPAAPAIAVFKSDNEPGKALMRERRARHPSLRHAVVADARLALMHRMGPRPGAAPAPCSRFSGSAGRATPSLPKRSIGSGRRSSDGAYRSCRRSAIASRSRSPGSTSAIR